MERKKILTYDEVAAYAPDSSDEQLVDVEKYSKSIVARYVKTDMIAITGPRIPVRDTVAKKLALVASDAGRLGLALKVVYGYRSPSIQRKYFDNRKLALRVKFPEVSDSELDRMTHNFVAVPDVAGHPTGGAVDVTLLDSSGREIDMGASIADFSDAEKIKTFAGSISKKQLSNRLILRDAMMRQGFAPFYGEWWHFSYGDREWAAFYDKSALYGQIDFSETLSLAAGGNGTAIQVLEAPLTRRAYATRGRLLGEKYEPIGAEQAGFLIPDESRFEMAGGEFCGNATRAAAVLLSQLKVDSRVVYTTSGFDGKVEAEVQPLREGLFYVEVAFQGMKVPVRRAMLRDQSSVYVVDLGGIVHVVVEADLPADYEFKHSQVVEQLGLGGRDAVGVVWLRRKKDNVVISPVVWVRDVATFFYESSCGSGSIAASRVAGVSTITQPSRKDIEVVIGENAVSLASEVEVGSVFDKISSR